MDKIYAFYNKFIELLPQIGLGVLMFLIAIIIGLIIRKVIVKRIKPKIKNQLLIDFIARIVSLSFIILGFIFFLRIVGLGGIATNLLAGAGILTFILGFAFKDIGENFLSGIILAFKSPFKIDDLIETLNIVGYVKEIRLREIVVKTTDGKDVFVPNSQILKNPLINYTIDGFLRYDFLIGLDYESDIIKAGKIIQNILENSTDIINEMKPIIVIEELMASSINLRIFYWIDTFKLKSKSHHLLIRSTLMNEIVKELSNNGFYMPADIIEIKNYKLSEFKQLNKS